MGYTECPGYRYVGVSCLVGAVIGSKLGMIFYVPVGDFVAFLGRMSELRMDGKTVLGALTGGYVGGEVGKRLVGVQFSTGDALALALPVGQAFGRLGCFLAGCCFGKETTVPWATLSRAALRHPVQLYESALCLALAAALLLVRDHARPPGHLFRLYLIGYASIRFSLEFYRGEPQHRLGTLSWAQVYCLVVVAVLAVSLRPSRRRSPAN